MILSLMFLNEIKSGQNFKVALIPQELKTILMRLGICEGEELSCINKIPGGPIVLVKDLQEIAIGENYSKRIEVIK